MKVTRTGAAILLMAAALPGVASAQGIGEDSYVELEYLLDGDGEDTFFLVGDVSYSVAPGGLGFGGIGLDIGLLGYAGDVESDLVLFIAPTIGIGASGTIAVGIPRPALSDFYDGPAIGGNRINELRFAAATGSTLESVYLFGDIDPPIGIRYDGNYGNLRVATSLHHVSDTDTSIVEAMLRYAIGQVELVGGIEVIDDDTASTESRFMLGASGESGQWRGGLYYFEESFVVGPDDGFRGFVTYAPSERIGLSGTVLTNTDGDYVAGFSMDYAIGPAGYAQLGILDGNNADPLYDLSVGFKF